MLRSASLILCAQTDTTSVAKLSIVEDSFKITLEPHIDNLKFNTPISISNHFLKIETIQKMILRFLTEKRIPKEKLAECLGVTVRSLEQLCSKNAPLALIPKVNLSLIKLYCRAKF